MSLLRQLLLSVSVAMLVILAGTLWFALDGVRGYLNERLQADAANAAASLALSLSQPANQDPVTQEQLMKALFDSGQFRSISFHSPSGEVLQQLDATGRASQATVPSWFDALLPIQAPMASRAVSDGGKQTGEISVVPEDAAARENLWGTAWRVLALVLAAGLLWAAFAVLLVRWLRRALTTEVTEQVRAIAEGSASSSAAPPVPRIKELAGVQTVIHSVRQRVRATADEQNRHIETLQIDLNTDEVTGVANRRFFINELQRCLSPYTSDGAAHVAYGHVLIFRQRDLASINAKHDRQVTDSWLASVGRSVRKVLEDCADVERPAPQVARLNGSDFVVLLAAYDGPDATDLIEAMRQTLSALRIQTADKRLCRWGYALTDYGPNCDVGQVLARLDHGLMRAENAGHDEVEYMASSEYRSFGPTAVAGETAWKTLIQGGLQENRLILTVQRSTYRNDDTPDRHEALLGLRGDDASVISGYLFMPPAVRLGLSGACDLRAVVLACDWVRDNPGTLVVRISLASLLLPDFLNDLEGVLRSCRLNGTDLPRLILEIDAHGFVAYPDEMDAFCELAVNCAVGVGVRRLAEQPAALLRLHKVRIRYIKLGGDLISGLLDSPGAVQLIAAITEAAIGQGVKIYAHDVPNQPTADLLREYGVLLPADEVLPEEEELHEGEFVDN